MIDSRMKPVRITLKLPANIDIIDQVSRDKTQDQTSTEVKNPLGIVYITL